MFSSPYDQQSLLGMSFPPMLGQAGASLAHIEGIRGAAAQDFERLQRERERYTDRHIIAIVRLEKGIREAGEEVNFKYFDAPYSTNIY